MAIVSKLTAIGIIVFSLMIGYLSFYVFSELPKEQKKKQLEEITSQFINLVIFIWLGKIILNLSIFLSDPLPILAYPSDSKSFYFAILCIVLLLLYKTKRKNLDIVPLLGAFAHVFLFGSFVYEFIQLVAVDNTYAFGYLILLAILIGIFLFLRERWSGPILLMILAAVWSMGMISLSVIQPFVTVFGYIMEPWFVGLILIISVGCFTYKSKKRDA